MRKLKQGRKLSREKNQRKALLKTLAASLFLKEKIRTTEAKAKELAVSAEKFITMAKKSGLANRRYLARFFPGEVVKKLMDEYGPRYKDRAGGYTRVIKLGLRKGDGAKIAIIELVK